MGLMMGRPVLLSLVVLSLMAFSVYAEAQTPCGVGEDADPTRCAGYDPDVTFCEAVYCDPEDGECKIKPGPCSGPCLESDQRCVECLSDADCTGDETPFCDTNEHWCRGCTNDAECSDRVSWCDGGPGQCNVASGLCVASGEPPCGPSAECQNELRQCFECRQDADCGEYDFCENPVECDTQNGQCVVRPPRCDSMASENDGAALMCSSTLQACVECESDDDCLMRETRFCAPAATCSPDTGMCEPSDASASETTTLRYCGGDGVPDTDEPLQVCVEARKTCQDVPCTTNEDCTDGVPSDKGGFKYCDQKTAACRRTPVDPGSNDAPTEPHRGGLPQVGDECQSSGDCDDAGLVCRPPLLEEGDVDATRTCNPCVGDDDCTRADETDAQVLSGQAGDAKGRSQYRCLPSGRCNWPGLSASGAENINARFNRADSVWMQWQAGHRSQNLNSNSNQDAESADAVSETNASSTSWGATTVVIIIIISGFLVVGLVFIVISVAAFKRRSPRKQTKRV